MSILATGKNSATRRALFVTDGALLSAPVTFNGMRRLVIERGLESEFELYSVSGPADGISHPDVDLQASWLIDSGEAGLAVALGADQAVAEGFHFAVMSSIAAVLDHVCSVWDDQATFVTYGVSASAAVERLRLRGRLVFTNGVFDLLHAGHVRSLEHTRRLGEALVVGLNNDVSARALRPSARPIIGQFKRAELLSALGCVDAVILFNDPDPIRLIKKVRPDVLVKGGTYSEGEVAGGELMRSIGGVVKLSPVLKGNSTSAIIKQIINEADANRL